MRRRRMFSPILLALGAVFMVALVVLQAGYAMWPAPWPLSLIWSDDVSIRGRQLVLASFVFSVLAFGACAIGSVFAISSMRRTARMYDRSVRARPPALRRAGNRWVPFSFLPGVAIVSWPLLQGLLPAMNDNRMLAAVVLAATLVSTVSLFRLVITILIRARRHGYSICPNCGYALRGLAPFGTCPECSKAYDLRLARRQWKFWCDRSLTLRAIERATRRA